MEPLIRHRIKRASIGSGFSLLLVMMPPVGFGGRSGLFLLRFLSFVIFDFSRIGLRNLARRAVFL